jgi:RNA polymerase sigma-70 factor (ECF subfamily)
MTLPEERELLQRIQSDRKEFGALFDHYYKPIFGYLYRRMGDYDLARDMAAETFLKACLKIDDFVWRDVSISSWLYRIATNEANLYFRKRKYKPLMLDRILNTGVPVQADGEEEREALEAEMKQQEEFVLIQQKLKQLDTRYQEVISLRYFENKDNREIGVILNKPEGTIKSLISRGLEKLRVIVLS